MESTTETIETTATQLPEGEYIEEGDLHNLLELSSPLDLNQQEKKALEAEREELEKAVLTFNRRWNLNGTMQALLFKLLQAEKEMLMQKYELGEQDTIDLATGLITRGGAATTDE